MFSNWLSRRTPSRSRPPRANLGILSAELLEDRTVPALISTQFGFQFEVNNGQTATNEQLFLAQAAQSQLLGLVLASTAAQKASSPAVQQLANQLLAFQLQSAQQLLGVMAQTGVFISPSLVQQTIQFLNANTLPGAAFNQQFLNLSVQTQALNLALFQAQSQAVPSLVQSFAANMLPALQFQLSRTVQTMNTRTSGPLVSAPLVTSGLFSAPLTSQPITSTPIGSTTPVTSTPTTGSATTSTSMTGGTSTTTTSTVRTPVTVRTTTTTTQIDRTTIRG